MDERAGEGHVDSGARLCRVVAVALVVGAAQVQRTYGTHAPLPGCTGRGEAAAPTGIHLQLDVQRGAVAGRIGGRGAVEVEERDEGIAPAAPAVALADAGEREGGATVIQRREVAVIEVVVPHAEQVGAFHAAGECIGIGGVLWRFSAGEKRKDNPPREEECFACHA